MTLGRDGMPGIISTGSHKNCKAKKKPHMLSQKAHPLCAYPASLQGVTRPQQTMVRNFLWPYCFFLLLLPAVAAVMVQDTCHPQLLALLRITTGTGVCTWAPVARVIQRCLLQKRLAKIELPPPSLLPACVWSGATLWRPMNGNRNSCHETGCCAAISHTSRALDLYVQWA